MYFLSDYEYFDTMRYVYVSSRQSLCYAYTVCFDICTTLFQQILAVFNTKYFKQIRQLYLQTPQKKHCYISSIWLDVNETRMSIKDVKSKGVDVNHMKVLNDNLSLRINMANLSLRDAIQSRDHVNRYHQDPIRGQTNELTDDRFQDENSKAHHIDDIETGKWKRTLTEKGKQFSLSILDKKKKMMV